MVCGFIKKDGTGCQRTGKCPWHKECPVCLEVGKGSFKKLQCGHDFHESCIETWKSRGNRTCPVCRAEFMKPEYRVNLSITRISDGQTVSERTVMEEAIVNALSDVFNLDFQTLSTPNIVTDIGFEVENERILREIFNDIGLTETLNGLFPF